MQESEIELVTIVVQLAFAFQQGLCLDLSIGLYIFSSLVLQHSLDQNFPVFLQVLVTVM